MKATLIQKQSQHLTMTPELQQAIRLLQLSGFELEQTIQAELLRNPLLETENSTETDNTTEIENATEPDNNLNSLNLFTSYNHLTSFNHHDLQSNYNSGTDFPKLESFSYRAELSLEQHILGQLKLSSYSLKEQQIALALIECIDENGYLTADLTAIQDNLYKQQLTVTLSEIESMIGIIQTFDPVGIGARNLAECLSIQLKSLPSNTAWLEQTKALVVDYLELLGKRDYKRLQRLLKLSDQDLEGVLKLLKQLDPKPGSKLLTKNLDYIIPDVIVRNHQHRLQVELNTVNLPKLRINKEYATHIQRQPSSTNESVFKQYLQEAQWFLKSIQNRQETLLKVASSIVTTQARFFEFGDTAIKPLTLQAIADLTGLHESTISRVTKEKYMSTPRGVYELKYFFSNSIHSDDTTTSATAIRAVIKKIIAKEAKDAPLSDDQITKLLNQQGIKVSRRVVNKYRIAMNILPSSQRRRYKVKDS